DTALHLHLRHRHAISAASRLSGGYNHPLNLTAGRAVSSTVYGLAVRPGVRVNTVSIQRSHEVKKSSSAVVLVLLSAIALPLGCSRQRECKNKLADGRPDPNCHGAHSGSGGVHYVGTPSGSRSGGASGTAPRGGFGVTGGAHASGS